MSYSVNALKPDSGSVFSLTLLLVLSVCMHQLEVIWGPVKVRDEDWQVKVKSVQHQGSRGPPACCFHTCIDIMTQTHSVLQSGKSQHKRTHIHMLSVSFWESDRCFLMPASHYLGEGGRWMSFQFAFAVAIFMDRALPWRASLVCHMAECLRGEVHGF